MTYGKRLKEVRKNLNMTQSAFAKALNINNKQTISDVENGKQQKLMSESEIILFEKFGISAFYMATGKHVSSSHFGKNSIGFVDKAENIHVGDRVNESSNAYGEEDTISFEYYPEVYASAGGGAMVYESLAHTEPMRLSRAFVEDFLGITTQKNMHILNVKGDSMEPTILDGELIFVLPLNGDGIVDGNIYVMMYKDEIYVKRVRREAFSGTYTLSSDNTAVGDINLTQEQSNDCQIIGEVVGQMRRKG